MDPTTILTQVLIGAGANLTSYAIQSLWEKMRNSNPSLEKEVMHACTQEEIDASIKKMTQGILNVTANEGSIFIDGAVKSALRLAYFDHKEGKIAIRNRLIEAPVLQTGGTIPCVGHSVLPRPKQHTFRDSR